MGHTNQGVWLIPLIFSLFCFILFISFPAVLSLETNNYQTNNSPSLPDLLIESITIPAFIYTEEESPIFITIRNEGDDYYTGDADISLSITANCTHTNIQTETLQSVIAPKESVPVYSIYNFSDVAKTTSLLIEIDPEGRIEETSKINNNVTLSVVTHKRTYNVSVERRINATESSFAYLEDETGDLDSVSYCHVVAVAPLNTTFYELMEATMTTNLERHTNDILNSTKVRDWAAATIAISSIGEKPRDFSGINFVGTLYSFFDYEQFGCDTRLDDDIFALIALSAAGERNSIINDTAANLMAAQNKEDGGWSWYTEEKSSVTLTSLAIQAVFAVGIVNSDNESVKNATEFLKRNQLGDGGFPYKDRTENRSSPYATALAISALSVSNQSQNSEAIETATEYLLLSQDKAEYFTDSAHSELKTTTYALAALYGTYSSPFQQIPVNVALPDIYPVNFSVNQKDAAGNDTFAYANITNEVTANIKNNGGAFNVSLIHGNGTVLAESRLTEKNSTAITPVKFEWRPTSDAKLTISADTNAEIKESNERNNTISKQIVVKLPDLYPDLCLLKNETFYSNFSNTLPIKVNGFGENFNSTLAVNASVDNVSDSSVSFITNITCYVHRVVNFTWKPKFAANYRFTLGVDTDNDVIESDETNNTESGELTVKLPDVAPYNLSFVPPANESYKNKILLVNNTNLINVSLQGAGERFNVSLFAYPINETANFSINMTNMTNSRIKKETVSRLYGTRNISFQWCPREEGFYRIVAVADSDDDVYESNESNNCIFGDIEAIKEAPEVKLITPRGGETFSDVRYITVKWSATDPNNDYLNISISYSPAYRRNWIKIEDTNETAGEHSWDITNMADGVYMLKVEASDGNFSGTDMTVEPFTICTKKSYEEAAQFHYNAGFSLSEAPDTSEIAWSTPDIGAVDSSQPIVAEGKVFVYCDNETGTFLVALNANDGKIIQNWDLDKRAYGSWSSPGYHNGNIFIGSGKKVYSIDPESGTVNWKSSLEQNVVISSPTIISEKVFIGGYGADGHPEFYCLDEDTGMISWAFNDTIAPGIANITGSRATSTPAYYGGDVFVGFGSGDIGSSGAPSAVYCLSNDGKEVWNTTTDYGVWGSITAIHGILYFGTYNFDGAAKYYAIYPQDGTEKWNITGIRTNSAPAYASGNLYISAGCLGHSAIATYCFDPENRNELWKAEDIGGWTISPVISSDGKLIVGKTGSNGVEGTYCLDASTGNEIWDSHNGGSTAVIANGRVYTIGQHKLWCFGANNTQDLFISHFAALETVYVGETRSVNVLVNSIGEVEENMSFNVSLRANGRLIDTIVKSLNADGGANISFNWTVTEADWDSSLKSASGNRTCRLVAEVDPDDVITETNPINNKAWQDVTLERKEKAEDELPSPATPPPPPPAVGSGTRGGGGGGGSAGGFGAGSGTGESGSGDTGGMQMPVNVSTSAAEEETKHEVSGYPFGNISSGAAGGGGTIPLLLVVVAVFIMTIFYLGYYKEKKSHAKHISPGNEIKEGRRTNSKK
ncbi:Outer membrane protein assembly factor BamB, contains PQQ-like beta-propeller repeat [Candidatus Methanophagaceae archaeon]|nr:Outer membrane protein assembly factor BamB, contains PQQ-like beta-propeller repeat [Methanophagales archaeon]